MRAKEFIVEREFATRKSDTMPNTRTYPSMPSANPYQAYRFGMAMANHEIKNATGPTNNWAVIAMYTPEEEEIVNHAEKVTGHKGTQVADKGSHEPDSTNVTSPVAKSKKNRYGV